MSESDSLITWLGIFEAEENQMPNTLCTAYVMEDRDEETACKYWELDLLNACP